MRIHKKKRETKIESKKVEEKILQNKDILGWSKTALHHLSDQNFYSDHFNHFKMIAISLILSYFFFASIQCKKFKWMKKKKQKLKLYINTRKICLNINCIPESGKHIAESNKQHVNLFFSSTFETKCTNEK